MERRTRKRPSLAGQSVLSGIAATAQQGQDELDLAVQQLVGGIAAVDVAIVKELAAATNPGARLARIIRMAASQSGVLFGGDELLAAVDELRYAIDPSHRPLDQQTMADLWNMQEGTMPEGLWG